MNDPVVEFTPAVVDEDTDEIRAQRALERDERTDRPLHEFFLRRVTDYWHRQHRSKYDRHVGITQRLMQEEGFTRREARDAVRRYHAVGPVEIPMQEETTSGEG